MRFKRTGILTKIVIAVVFIYALVSLARLNDRKAEAQEQLQELKQQEAQLAAENDRMQYAIDNADDDEVIRDIAREHGYVDPDEKVF